MKNYRPHLFLSLFLVLASLTSCAEQGQLPMKAFEGTITEVIQVPGIGEMVKGMSKDSDNAGANAGMSMLGAAANMRLKIYVKADKVAYDMSMLGGLVNVRSIIDRNTRTMTMLLPGHTVMVQNLRSMDSIRGKLDDSIRMHSNLLDSLMQLVPQPTGKKETIEGLNAEEYHAKNGSMDVTMWLSGDEKVKTFEIIRDAFLGRGQTGTGGMEQIFDLMRPIAGKVPVKFETKVNGKTFAKGELKDITEEKVEDSIFEIPQGYTVLNTDSLSSEFKSHKTEKKKTVTGPSEE